MPDNSERLDVFSDPAGKLVLAKGSRGDGEHDKGGLRLI
jgi:hypothetical protein